MNIFFLFLLLWTFSTSPFFFVESSPRVEGRIIGGQSANSVQFPYAAAVHPEISGAKFFCGGTLISDQWVLTAGQCVNGATLFEVSFGSVSLEGDDPIRLIVGAFTYVLHPDFNPTTLANDIGLIDLQTSLPFSDYVKSVNRLPLYDVGESITVTAYGWGQISDDNTALSNTLNWVVLNTISNLECQSTYGTQITENMVCVVGSNNEGTCTGDTGSALLQYYSNGYVVPVGIASFLSANGCENSDPSGFTRVYPYNDWIRNTTGLANL